jgi:proteasome lid subunit RPN8/RPN11
MDLILAPGILEEVIQRAKDGCPNEACGLLVGRDAVDRFIPVKNIAAGPDRYEMDPAELISVLRNLRETGEKLLAVFHSHPQGPAELSKTDIEHAYYPEAAHLIISLADPDRPQAAAFRIVDGQAIAVELRVIV